MIACAIAVLLWVAELPHISVATLPTSAPAEILGESATLKLQVGRSHLLRTKADIRCTAIATDGIVEITQFTSREMALVGRGPGSTTVTFWFSDPAQPPVTYAVTVVASRPSPK